MPTFGFDGKELSQTFAADISGKEDLEKSTKIIAITKSCWYGTR
jgi:hypothetical protein